MNILAVDYGQKRIGLAWMQEGLDVILPFGVVRPNLSLVNPYQELIDVIQNERIGKVIIGLPLGEDGEETVNTERVRVFATEIQKHIEVPCEFVDERFTTHEANRMGGTASADEKAAMLILESYIGRN